jgi:hypothetical protein
VTECVNLLEMFGDRFRVSFDPAYDPDHVPRTKLDPWMMQLLCERGVIYPYGGDRLAVEIDSRPQTAKAVGAIPGVVLYQDGSTEKTFLFPLSLFDQVAGIVRPRKRRRLSDEQRAAFVSSGSATRFPSRGSDASQATPSLPEATGQGVGQPTAP